MRVGCVICSDTFSTFVDVSTIPCGHTFHTYCLLQWIEKSKSCPTCRQKAPSKSVVKLYFDATGADTSQLNPDYLQNDIDSLKFQVLEKTQALKTANEENSEFKTQTKGLRDEVLKLEKRGREKDTTIGAYKEQLRHFDTLVKNASKAEEEARSANSQLKLYKRIKSVLDENSPQIEDTILSNTSGANSSESIKNLATISCVLKSRVNRLVDDKRRYADENHSLMSKLKETNKSFNANNDKLALLEKETSLQREDVQALEAENRSLQAKLRKLHAAVVSPSGDVKNNALRRLIAESPAPADLKRAAANREESDLTPEITRRKVCRTSQYEGDVSTQNGTSASQDESGSSPYLKVKSAPITALSRAPGGGITVTGDASPKTASSIFRDGRNSSNLSIGARSKSWARSVPIYERDAFGYDGLGGHHKVDAFPAPGAAGPPKRTATTHRAFKVVSAAGKGPASAAAALGSKTIKDFFKDPFAQ